MFYLFLRYSVYRIIPVWVMCAAPWHRKIELATSANDKSSLRVVAIHSITSRAQPHTHTHDPIYIMPRRRLCDDHPSPVDRLSHRRRRSLNLSRDAHPHHAKIWNENRHRFPRHVKACCLCVKLASSAHRWPFFHAKNVKSITIFLDRFLIVTSAQWAP